MMKKTPGMLLVICILLAALPACAEKAELSEEETLLVGNRVFFDGIIPAGTVSVNADGTYEKYGLDGTLILTGAWSAADGVFRDRDQKASYTPDGITLTLVTEQETLTLTRIPE